MMNERINELFEELVPMTGKAESLAGEIVRAVSRIGYRFYNDGDQIGVGYGKETCNPAARFLTYMTSYEIKEIVYKLWSEPDEKDYEAILSELVDAVVKYIDENPDLRNQETPDMFDYTDETEDVDDSWDEEEDYWDDDEDDYEEEYYDEDED